MSLSLAKVDRATRVVGLLVVLAVLATMTYALWPNPPRKHLTAEFPRTVGLYAGSDVRVLGVPIGTVDSVTPHGTSVRVAMSYEAKYKIPASAKAVIVAPSIVSDRYVQLTPAYTKGTVMADGAKLPLDRGAVPVELDRIYSSLDELSVALGPEGANKNGALDRALGTSARVLKGEGKKLHDTIGHLADATGTLADSKDELFATVRQLDTFTAALADNDQQVRKFDGDLADVAAQLAGERDDLHAALADLSVALTQVADFVHENRDLLHSNVHGLTELTGTLVKQQNALREVLDDAPAALSNLDAAYNPGSGTLDTRLDLAQTDDPGLYLCTLLTQLGQPEKACKGLKQVLDKLPKLPRIPGGKAGSSDGGSAGSAPRRDLTLGGLLPDGGR